MKIKELCINNIKKKTFVAFEYYSHLIITQLNQIKRKYQKSIILSVVIVVEIYLRIKLNRKCASLH